VKAFVYVLLNVAADHLFRVFVTSFVITLKPRAISSWRTASVLWHCCIRNRIQHMSNEVLAWLSV